MAATSGHDGFFVALEGIDGSGKTSVAIALANFLRSQHGHRVVLTREPGGTAIGEQIRDVILRAHDMRPETEVLLFAAARAQHVAEVIAPALRRGDVVISDRFVDSSLAYQWGGRGLPFDAVRDAQGLALHGLAPDLKILLDLPVDRALRRRLAEVGSANRLDLETVQFHERVRTAYHQLAAATPTEWRIVDASGGPEQVAAAVIDAVLEFMRSQSKQSAPRVPEIAG